MPSPANSLVFAFQGTESLQMGVTISQNGDISQRKWVASAKISIAKTATFWLTFCLVLFGLFDRGSLVAKPCLKLQDYLELLILHVSTCHTF